MRFEEEMKRLITIANRAGIGKGFGDNSPVIGNSHHPKNNLTHNATQSDSSSTVEKLSRQAQNAAFRKE